MESKPHAAVFIELPAFSRHRADYLDDDAFRALQYELLENPEPGDVIVETGGLRKLRQADSYRRKGKRGGLRIIYFWWTAGRQFWLFTLYDKGEMTDLSVRDKAKLRQLLKTELNTRARRGTPNEQAQAKPVCRNCRRLRRFCRRARGQNHPAHAYGSGRRAGGRDGG